MNVKSLRESWSRNMNIILRTWAGRIGVVLLLVFIGMALFVMVEYYPDVTSAYGKGIASYWPYRYPFNAPPCWTVKDKFRGLYASKADLNDSDIIKGVIKVPGLFGFKLVPGYQHNYTYVFTYNSKGFPSDVLMMTSVYAGSNITFVRLTYYVERPDGSRVVFYNSTLQTGSETILYGSKTINGNKTLLLPLGLRKVSSSSIIYQYMMNSLQRIYGNTTEITPSRLNELLFGKIIHSGNKSKIIPMEGAYKIVISISFIPEKGFNPSSNKSASVELTSFQWKMMPNCYGLFGTDNSARPVGFGLLLGVPYAFYIGFTVTFISTFIGAIYGTIAGYWKDIRGEALMRIADIVNSLPFLPILIVLSFVFKQAINLTILAGLMIALFWAGPVIIVRSMSLQISEQLYIEAAKASGVGTSRIVFRHIFPQILPYTIAISVLSIPGIIVTEAGLSLLGFGDPTAPTWGKMLQNAYDSQAIINGWWWTYLFPGLALVVFSATFLLIGRAIEPIVSPKMQK